MLERHVPLDGARVVDVGCGFGALVRHMRSRGADAIGVECGAAALAAARAAEPAHADRYLEGVGQDLPIGDGEVDAVVFSYSLHHVPAQDMDAALAEAHRVLRPGGIVYVVEPVAAGPGHEVARLVDDETVVRALAQDALDRAAAVGLEPTVSSEYTNRRFYDGPDAYVSSLVGVDPERAGAVEAVRDELVARFLEHGSAVDGGWEFLQDNVLRVFRKPV